MKLTKEDLQLISNTIKVLSMDAVQRANSGHPGMPMGCSDIAAVLWTKILNHNPDDPDWVNRDRFILSAGHGSMLLYSVLYLSGYSLDIEDLKSFRQPGSLTPGHPEYKHTRGVETTTGPLGQGFANGIGMAIAGKIFKEEFSQSSDLIDHYIYALVSDGDIMEGISSEAASIAGHLGLGEIIYIYDSNRISIEGSTNLTFSEDVALRFNSCNWHVQQINGHDHEEIEDAVLKGQKETGKPSIIIARTSIAKGSPNKENSAESHGAPLGEDEVKAVKRNMGWDENKTFYVPERVYEIFDQRKEELHKIYNEWNDLFEKTISGELKDKWNRYFTKPDIRSLRGKIPAFETGSKIATRSAGGKVLEVLYKKLPNLMGGSADLAPSNKTLVKGYRESGKNSIGRNIHFGIREHSMGAIQNGIAYYGGLIPFSATFLVFMDYMRPPMRIAALSGLHTVYVFTHDSFFVGEDGPTHQPVEQIASARAIPELHVIRPADAEETKEAWLAAIDRSNGPTMLVLTRQNLPVLERGKISSPEDLHKGAYIIYDTEKKPDIIILASGSEVHISIEAAKELKQTGIDARVVSFPSWELFDLQSEQYRESVVPPRIPCAVVEAGIKMGWEKYSGKDALFITLERFGASAPGEELAKIFGFTKENIAERVKEYLSKL